MTSALVSPYTLPSGMTAPTAFAAVKSAVYDRDLNDLSIQLQVWADMDAYAAGRPPIDTLIVAVPKSAEVGALGTYILQFVKAHVPGFADAVEIP